jgi:dTMP kinase
VDRPATADGLPHPGELVAAANVGRAKNVLSIRSFRQLYTALVLSSFGDWLGFLATTALAAQLVDGFTAKAYATGGVLVFRLLPAVLFGPVAGAFADRFDRRHTMVFCDVARFALFVSIPLSHSLVYLLIASFLIESLSLFWIPAKEASVPNLVPRNRLESANQLSLIATYGSAPVAAAVFAALGLVSRALGNGVSFFSTRPVDLALYVDAATFLFSALTILRLDIPSPKGERRSKDNPDAPGFAASLREGLAFMRTEPLARGLLVGMLGALAAGGAIIAQGKLFAAILGGGDAAYGLLFGCIFLGIAAGVALGPRLIGDLSRRRLFGPSIVGAGLSLAAMAVVPNLAVVTVLTLLVGSFAAARWRGG